MRVYYEKRIYPTFIDDEIAENSKCFYITRLVQTDTELYEDKVSELFWNEEYHGLTSKEADEKVAGLNAALDSSKPPLSKIEQFEADCKTRESLKILIEEHKLELAKLEKRLNILDNWIRHRQRENEIPTARNLKLPNDFI